MKVLIYKGQSGYDALRVFADELAAELGQIGCHVRVLDFTSSDAHGQLKDIFENRDGFLPDIIFSMNGIEAGFRTDSGRLFHNETGIPFVSYIVDHPLYHHERLKTRLRDHHVLCANEGFAEYVKTYYKVKSAAILMQAGLGGEFLNEGEHAGGSTKIVDIFERPYNIVFPGTYRGEKEIEAAIEKSNPTVRNVACCMLEELIDNPGLRLEDGLMTVLKKQNITLAKDTFADTMNAMHLADKYVRALYRKMAVKSLLQNGIKVDVWGERWQELIPELREPGLLNIHAPVSYREAAKIYGQSKMVLNVMPWAKEGLHDRMLSAMLNGAVCVSDETTTLVEKCKEKECALVYSLAHLEKLPAMVKEVLRDKKRMENIAENGFIWAEQSHTYKQRAKELKEHFERILGN